MHNLLNRKACKVIVHYLAERAKVLKYLKVPTKLHMLMPTRQTHRGIKKKLKKAMQEVEKHQTYCFIS